MRAAFIVRRVLSFISLCFWSLSVCGQDILPQNGLADTLDAISVIDFAVRNITPVRTLEGEALQRMSSHNVADALRFFSGVQIKDYGGVGGLKTVNVRSLGAHHVGVFYDGVKINNAQNGQVDLGRFSLDNMEAVSLYNGQKGEALQSAADYASASSVYLRTRLPALEGPASSFLARVRYGSYGTVSPSLRYERRLRRMSLSAEAMYLGSRGDYPFSISDGERDSTGRRVNGDIQAYRAEAGLFARPLGGDLRVHAYIYGSERGLPGPVVRRLSDQYAATDRQWDRNMFLQASYRRVWDRFAVLVNAKGTCDYLEYLSDPAENVAAVYTHNHYLQKDFYGSAAMSYTPVSWLSMNMALDERWSDLTCDVRYFNYVQRFDTRAAVAANVRAGGFTGQCSLLYTRIQDITRGGGGPLQRLTPTLTAGWSSGAWTLRSFCKSVFRAPTLNDLYYTLVGNANLRPECALQWDLGCDWAPVSGGAVDMKLSADIYLNRVRDKIVAMPVKSQFRWSMVNFGIVRGKGLDLSWNGILHIGDTSLRLLAGYGYEESCDCTDPSGSYYGGQIPYTPWHSGSFVADLSVGKWNACTSLLYTGVRYRTSDNMPESRMKPWMTADLSMSRDIIIRAVNMNLGIEVNNLFNRQYEVVSRYPMPGTGIMIKLQIKI